MRAHTGDESDGDGGGQDEEEEEEEGPECDASHGRSVKLDPLHAMQRITKTLKTAHGAYPYFLGRYEACAMGEHYSFIAVSASLRHRDHHVFMALLSASLQHGTH